MPDKKVKLCFEVWRRLLHLVEMSFHQVCQRHSFPGSAAANLSGWCVSVGGFIHTSACCLGWCRHRPCLATAISNRPRWFIKEPPDSAADWFSSWGHFSGFCAKATSSPRKFFSFLWLKTQNNWKNGLITIVGRLSSCSSSKGNDVKFMPQAVKRFLPDRKFPPFSPRLKCDILFRAAAHPVRRLRVATVTMKGQIEVWNLITMETSINWKSLFSVNNALLTNLIWTWITLHRYCISINMLTSI